MFWTTSLKTSPSPVLKIGAGFQFGLFWIQIQSGKEFQFCIQTFSCLTGAKGRPSLGASAVAASKVNLVLMSINRKCVQATFGERCKGKRGPASGSCSCLGGYRAL